MFCVCLATFTISAIVVVDCSDSCCLLFEKCTHERDCQGAPGLNHHILCHLLGAPFSHLILVTTICSKNQIFVKTCVQICVKIHSECSFKSLYFPALFFCSFSGCSKVRTCVWAMPVQSKSLRAQITWNTKWVQKSSEKVHKYTKKA